MASQHHGTFTWGPGPNSVSDTNGRKRCLRADSKVHVAGGFNGWSDTATPLVKQADGTFKADVPMPWGQKQAFKYIVDGGELYTLQWPGAQLTSRMEGSRRRGERMGSVLEPRFKSQGWG